jgi:hypothetical protein
MATAEGDFTADGWAVNIVEAFHVHVKKCHPMREFLPKPLQGALLRGMK